MKINSLKKQNHGYIVNAWSDKLFKDTVVNEALPSVHGGSFEITLTIPSSEKLRLSMRVDEIV